MQTMVDFDWSLANILVGHSMGTLHAYNHYLVHRTILVKHSTLMQCQDETNTQKGDAIQISFYSTSSSSFYNSSQSSKRTVSSPSDYCFSSSSSAECFLYSFLWPLFRSSSCSTPPEVDAGILFEVLQRDLICV